MADIHDYLGWRGDLSFDVSPINEVDIFICSQLSTPDYSGIVGDEPVLLSKAAEEYFKVHDEDVRNLGVLQSRGVLPMLKNIGSCERFKDVYLSGYKNIVDSANTEQFAAITVTFPNGVRCAAFRGTDDTIIGWKEDFNIALSDCVPAQQDAVDYLTDAASGFCGDIVVCGHSKGGNLAVYAAANVNSEIKDRIVSVYSFDGPGFRQNFLDGEDYKSVESLITTVLSQHSTVGVLLNRAGRAEIVHSNVSGPMAHDGFNWEVLGTAFVREDALSPASRTFEEAADKAISGMTDEELKAFIDDFFDILLSTGATTIAELTAQRTSAKLGILNAMRKSRYVSGFADDFADELIAALHIHESFLSGIDALRQKRVEKHD